MIVAIVIGALLAACALGFVITPLILGPAQRPPSDSMGPRSSNAQAGPDASSGEITAVDVLREIEFDRATGKLSDDDYGSLKVTYTLRALAEMRAPAEPRQQDQALSAERPAEPTVTCPSCGARAVADAAYCINCACYLAERCPACGGPVKLAAARFCSRCGTALGAEKVEGQKVAS